MLCPASVQFFFLAGESGESLIPDVGLFMSRPLSSTSSRGTCSSGRHFNSRGGGATGPSRSSPGSLSAEVVRELSTFETGIVLFFQLTGSFSPKRVPTYDHMEASFRTSRLAVPDGTDFGGEQPTRGLAPFCQSQLQLSDFECVPTETERFLGKFSIFLAAIF